MKTKLFLVVSCIFIAVSLNAQTFEVFVVESSNAAEANIVRATISAFDEGNTALFNIVLSEPLSSDMGIKGYVIAPHILGYSPTQIFFSVKVRAGETFGYTRFKKSDFCHFDENSKIYVDEVTPYTLECDGKTIVFNIPI